MKKIYVGTLYALLDGYKIKGIREFALNYTDEEEVINEIISLAGWYNYDNEDGSVVDGEKNAYERHSFFETPEGKKYKYTSGWYNPIAGDCDLREMKDTDKVSLRLVK